MSTFDIQSLETCFKNEQVKATFGSLFHSLGFITAVASAPEKIPAKEWMPQLVKPGSPDITFEEESVVENLNKGFVNWWRECDLAFEHGTGLTLPCALSADDAGYPDISLVEFSTGYLDAYNWLSGSWDKLLPKDNVEAVRSLALLGVLLGRFIDEKMAASQEPEIFEQLPELDSCLAITPKLICAVGMLGKDISQDHEIRNQAKLDKLMPITNEFKTVGRNDPCPCGSGKKFKKCCLH